MSDLAPRPYRGAAGAGSEASAGSPSLVVRYVCVASWLAVASLGLLASLFVWVVATQSADKALHSAPYALALCALFAFARFPVVTLRARVEGGHLVVSGRRWPGAETLWSCTLAEAAGFEEQTVATAAPGKKPTGPHHRLIALRTSEDQLLGLTHVAYATVRWPHPQVVARLNTWLAAAKARS